MRDQDRGVPHLLQVGAVPHLLQVRAVLASQEIVIEPPLTVTVLLGSGEGAGPPVT